MRKVDRPQNALLQRLDTGSVFLVTETVEKDCETPPVRTRPPGSAAESPATGGRRSVRNCDSVEKRNDL